MDTSYRWHLGDIIDVSFGRLEARMDAMFERFDAHLDAKIESLKSDVLRWMFLNTP